MDVYDEYITMNVKRAQLLWTYKETMDKINQMKPILHIELLIDIMGMISDCVFRNEQFLSYFFVPFSLENHPHDILFTVGYFVLLKKTF